MVEAPGEPIQKRTRHGFGSSARGKVPSMKLDLLAKIGSMARFKVQVPGGFPSACLLTRWPEIQILI